MTNILNEDSDKMKRSIAKPIIFLYLLLLSYSASLHINNLIIGGDSYDNLTGSFYLSSTGTISQGHQDAHGHMLKSNLREPFPIMLSALWIKINPSLNKIKTVDGFQKGKILELLKFQNIIYFFALLLGIYYLCLHLFSPLLTTTYTNIFAISAVTISYLCSTLFYLNTLLTEVQAAALIIWFSWAWIQGIESGKYQYHALAGLLMGLLILTKGAFVYIALGSLGFYYIWLFAIRAVKKHLLHHSVLIITILFTVLPWYIRNHYTVGVWELTQRGPVVLLTRAYENAMARNEFKGAFYAYSPLSLKKSMSKITGYNLKDHVDGGRLERLIRFPLGDTEKRELGDEEGAISYYIKATTHHKNTHKHFKATVPDPVQARVLADQKTKQEAMEIIFSDIGEHFKSTLIFAWRGAWPANTVDGRWTKASKDFFKPSIWSFIAPFIGLILMFGICVYGLISKNKTLVATTLLGTSAFCFYSLLTHFIPRYSEMFIPIWVLCACYILAILKNKIASSTVADND